MEALRAYSLFFKGRLIVESDTANAICWVFKTDEAPWKFHFLLQEIKAFSSDEVSFTHVFRKANFMADSLAKQGVDRTTSLLASLLCNDWF